MPTTANQNAEDPATSDPQPQPGSSEDVPQSVGECLQSLQSLPSVDTSQNTKLDPAISQQEALAHIEGSEVSEISQQEGLTHIEGSEVSEISQQEGLTHIEGSEVSEISQQEGLTHIEGSEVSEISQQEALTHIEGSEVSEVSQQEGLTHIESSEVSEISQQEDLTHIEGSEVSEISQQEALTHIEDSEVSEVSQQEGLTHISEVSEISQQEGLTTHIEGSEVSEVSQQEGLTHIEGSEVSEISQQEGLTHIEGSEVSEISQQEGLTHIEGSEVSEISQQEGPTHIQGNEVPEISQQEALAHVDDSEVSEISPQETLTQVEGSEVPTIADDLNPSQKIENDTLPATGSATSTTVSHDGGPDDNPASVPNKGFQDAFAAFASASLPEPEEEEMETQEDTVVGSDPGQVNLSENIESSYLEHSETNPASAPGVTDQQETSQSSEMDPGLANTTNDQVAGELLQENSPAGETFQHMLQNAQASGEMDSQLYQTPGENITEPVDQSIIQNQAAEAMEVQEQQQMIEQPAAEGSVPDHMTSSTDQQAAQESAAVSDSVYFIQGTDVNGEVVTSIIDPNDIGSYLDSVVYKQCMMPNGEIETTIVHSGVQPAVQEQQQQQPQQQQEEQVIYAHDLNGQLTPIDSAQSANDVAPPGKQFVYMQDSTGRIIRTIMDANQTMVPGQQVYYTQSDDGRIITSVMDPTSSGGAVEDQQPQEDQVAYQQQQQEGMIDNATAAGVPQQQPETVGDTANFNLDSGLSGLDMLAELSHLTAGQTPTASGLPTEPKGTSSTDSNSADMDEFRPVAMVTRRIGVDEGMDDVSSTMSGLHVGQLESPVYKLISELKPELQMPSLSVSRDNLFVQWQNLDAMCWMDVVLIMLVYSPTLRPLVNLDPGHELASTLLITLLKANRQAQVLVQNLLKKSNGAEITGLQTGAGNTATSIQDPKTAKLVCKENMDEIGKAINILYAMREKIWQALQPRLRCERGKHNSPVLVLPLLVREKPAIKQMFTMNYRYVFRCEKCGYTQDDVHTKILPSIPAVPDDFNMREPCFVRNCFECQAPNQRMMMKFEGLQDFVQMHFVKGLPHNRFDELSFDCQGDHYEVTAVVHYKNNPDHFIAWVRNAPGTTWMECDDLKSVITRYHHTMPAIPPSQVHMVMWERRLTPAHQLQMRDTEDTKVLASLVLTVQQPSTHQSSDPAARPTGLPSTGPSTPGPGKASSLLTSIPTQSPVFSPYVPRGRGRGGRGRGSRGGRGANSISTTPIIRRTAPINLTGNTAVNQTGSPQIVRLPLSALPNSSSSLGSTTKYVLMGNNGAGQGTGGTASKVVVVRSQGGANNLTAQQLLQLLQRTGAISQSGAKIAIATSGANTTAAITSTVTTNVSNTMVSNASRGSTSYIIQSDGTVLTTSAPVSTVAQPIQSGPHITNPDADGGSAGTSLDTTNSLSNNVGELKPSVKLVSVLPSALASLTSAYGQGSSSTAILPQDVGSGQMIMDQSSSQVPVTDTSVGEEQGFANQEASETPAEPQVSEDNRESLSTANNQQTLENDPLIVSPETTAPSTVSVTPSAATQQQGAASRFIQIPTSGGGSILTQLVVRNGKMVLVPVDKATQAQAQAQPSSVLKLSGGAVGSASKITLRTATSGTSQILSGNAMNSQPQQQQMDTTITSPPSLSSAAGPVGLSTLVSKGSQSFITMPGSKAATPKRTIQLISVPRAGQQNAKTFILNAGGDLNTAGTAAHHLSMPGEPVSNPTASDDQAVDPGQGRILSQEGNIVIRELRRPETSPATLTTTLLGDSGASLMSTPAVSLLRDVSSRSSGQAAASLVGDGQKQPESFKYILPGSNTTHILHTGNSTSASQMGSRAFTALSSSGTIIGGQLTPAVGSTAMGTSPMDQDLGLSDPEDSGGLFGLGTTEYVPMNRGRGRGGRGSRGGRTSRGSQRGRGRGSKSGGRGRASSELWSSMEMVAPGSSSQNISTLSGLRQVGAHVIESGAENVDGVPVLSIPEFSANQTEASSAVESIQGETAHMVPEGAGILGQDNQQPLASWTSPEDTAINASSNAMVITQSIPSVKANHGFDILTQGILGREAGGPPQTFKKARSLLTGAQVTTATPTFSGSHEQHASSNFSVPAITSPDPQEMSLPDQSSVQTQHSEIDTLIEAAFAAAKPSMSNSAQGNTAVESSVSVLSHKRENHTEPGKHDQRVVSVEERHVSTAEKYRMPVELFQPDDEPLEKLVKSDMWSTKILETVEQPEQQSTESVDQAQMDEVPEQLLETEEKQVEGEQETSHDVSDIQQEQQAELETEQLLDTAAGVNDMPSSGDSPALKPLQSTAFSGNTAAAALSPEHGAESPSNLSRQILDSEKEVLDEAMDTSSPIPPQSQADIKEQVMEMIESDLNAQAQETLSEARVEENNVVASPQKTPSRQRGRKKGHKRGRTGSRKASNVSTESDTNSISHDTKEVIQSEVVLVHQEDTTTSTLENDGNVEEKDVSTLQSSAERFEDIIETGSESVPEKSLKDWEETHEVEADTSLGQDSQEQDMAITHQNFTHNDAQINLNTDGSSLGVEETDFSVGPILQANINTEALLQADITVDRKTAEVCEEDETLDTSVVANGEQRNAQESSRHLEEGTSECEDTEIGQSISVEEKDSRQDVSYVRKLVSKTVKKGHQDSLKGIAASDCTDIETEKSYQAVLLKQRRRCVDWTKRMTKKEDHHFNYCVLSGGRLSKIKHPTIDFSARQQPVKKRIRQVTTEPLPAKVTRRLEKPLQPPKVNVSKDPSLVPMVVEGDQASTGGSVITCPNDGEMFTSVIVGHKRQQADWSSGDCEQEDGSEEGLPWDNSMSPEEVRLAKTQYCRQLTMVLFMQAGDISFLLANDENETDDEIGDNSLKSSSGANSLKDEAVILSEQSELREQAGSEIEEESKRIKDSDICGGEQHEPTEEPKISDTVCLEPSSTPDVACQSKPGRKRGRKKKHRGRSLPSPSSASPAISETPPTKRQRLSQEESEDSVLEVSSTAAVDEVSAQELSDHCKQHTDPLPYSVSDDIQAIPSSPILQVEPQRKRGRPKKTPVPAHTFCPEESQQVSQNSPLSKGLQETIKTFGNVELPDNKDPTDIVTSCHTNGIASPPPPMEVDQKEETNAYESPAFSPSSSRRSGRALIPSKKILD